MKNQSCICQDKKSVQFVPYAHKILCTNVWLISWFLRYAFYIKSFQSFLWLMAIILLSSYNFVSFTKDLRNYYKTTVFLNLFLLQMMFLSIVIIYTLWRSTMAKTRGKFNGWWTRSFFDIVYFLVTSTYACLFFPDFQKIAVFATL